MDVMKCTTPCHKKVIIFILLILAGWIGKIGRIAKNNIDGYADISTMMNRSVVQC